MAEYLNFLVRKFSICKRQGWHHKGSLCAWSLPVTTPLESITLTAGSRDALSSPSREHDVWPAAGSHSRARVTRHHRELNEPLAKCRLFIDGPTIGDKHLPVRWRKDLITWGTWVTPVDPAAPNCPTLAFSGRNPLRNHENWVKASFVLEWERFLAISYRKEWNKSLWANLTTLFEINLQNIWYTPTHKFS